MAEEVDKLSEILETDIVFDCPNCGKSLAIDSRGAGRTVACTDCGENVEVPGDDVNAATRIAELEAALAEAQATIAGLEEDLSDTALRRSSLERTRTDNMFHFGSILERVSVMREMLGDISNELSEASKSVND